MKKILMIATGGTIASEPSPDGLIPSLSGSGLIKMLPALKSICRTDCLELMSMDSSNLVPADWLAIGRAVSANYDKYDGFVITHGTDTMAYTAAALPHILKNLAKPVILTGAQLPIKIPGSDAPQNILDAFTVACEGRAGVYLVFSSAVHNGSRVKKIYSENFIGFASINAAPAGEITNGKVSWSEPAKSIPSDKKIVLTDRLEEKICVLKLIPGLSPSLLDVLVDNGYKGIIIEGYGAGGVPTDKSINNFLPAIKRALEKNTAVVCTTQCMYDGAHLDKYPIGVLAARLGAASGTVLTTEELVIRLMIILAETRDQKEIKKYIESH